MAKKKEAAEAEKAAAAKASAKPRRGGAARRGAKGGHEEDDEDKKKKEEPKEFIKKIEFMKEQFMSGKGADYRVAPGVVSTLNHSPRSGGLYEGRPNQMSIAEFNEKYKSLSEAELMRQRALASQAGRASERAL